MARAALISAALRHIRDAEHLLAPGPNRSVEQALHLAGFAPECARKGCIDEATADKALGHDFKGAPDSVTELVLALDPAASRYAIDEHAARLPKRTEHWTVDCRYMASGRADQHAQMVGDVVSEARAFVDECVLELWANGELPAAALTPPEA